MSLLFNQRYPGFLRAIVSQGFTPLRIGTIEERRPTPGDDLISVLTSAEEGSGVLTPSGGRLASGSRRMARRAAPA